jgi:predicted metal-dependent hydrolase
MMTLKGRRLMEYTLVRSRRKSIGITVYPSAQVKVHAPFRASQKTIDAFVAREQKWIEQKVHEMQMRLEKKAAFEVNINSQLLYRGKFYPIVAQKYSQAFFDGSQFCFPENLSPQEMKAAAIAVYRKLAQEYLLPRATAFSLQLRIPVGKISISNAQGRWGSNSKRKDIRFSWMLMMADDAAIDSVIVHELCHCIYPNHSKLFWDAVRKYVPTLDDDEKRLNALTLFLRDQDWTNK